MKVGADAIATGHYARRRVLPRWSEPVAQGPGPAEGPELFPAPAHAGAAQSKVLFPVGELPKTEVRRLATGDGVCRTRRRRTATGICFIGERPFREFLNRYLKPGARRHRGRARAQAGASCRPVASTRLGQRQGLGIGGVKRKGARRVAAASTNPGSWRTRTSTATASSSCRAMTMRCCSTAACGSRTPAGSAGSAPGGRPLCAAKTRYRQGDADCALAGPHPAL